MVTTPVVLNNLTVNMRKYLRMAVIESLGLSPNRVIVPNLSVEEEVHSDGKGRTYIIRGTATVNLDGADAVQSDPG